MEKAFLEELKKLSWFKLCFRSAIIGLWLKLRKLTVAQVEDYKNKRRVITSLIWFFCSLGIAVIVPTIGDAIAIVGALAAHFIFTFPGERSCDGHADLTNVHLD